MVSGEAEQVDHARLAMSVVPASLASYLLLHQVPRPSLMGPPGTEVPRYDPEARTSEMAFDMYSGHR